MPASNPVFSETWVLDMIQFWPTSREILRGRGRRKRRYSLWSELWASEERRERFVRNERGRWEIYSPGWTNARLVKISKVSAPLMRVWTGNRSMESYLPYIPILKLKNTVDSELHKEIQDSNIPVQSPRGCILGTVLYCTLDSCIYPPR